MREKALVSLGLCCLIAKVRFALDFLLNVLMSIQNMALRSFQLFMGQIENAPDELKVQVLKVVLDLLIMYDQEFFKKSEAIVRSRLNRFPNETPNPASVAGPANHRIPDSDPPKRGESGCPGCPMYGHLQARFGRHHHGCKRRSYSVETRGNTPTDSIVTDA